jgi:hypothetical protein
MYGGNGKSVDALQFIQQVGEIEFRVMYGGNGKSVDPL